MTSEILRIADQVFRLVYVARNVAYHRSLQPFNNELNQNYWILIFNNFLDISVLEWCKVFGSKNQNTHWSRHVENKDEFRNGMLARLEMSQEEWQTYWSSVKDYRDKSVAHHQSNPNITHYLDLGPALTACFYYYEKLIAELHNLKVYDYPDDLESYFESSLSQASDFSKIAYEATKEIEEKVY